MSNPRLLINNIADRAGIYGVPTFLTTLPETYLQSQARTKCGWTTSVGTQEIRLTWDTDQRVNMVALRYHNLSAAAQMAVVLYSDTAFSSVIATYSAADCFNFSGKSNALDLTSFDFRILKNSARYMTLATNVRGIKITITDPANLDGHMEFSRVFAGEYWEFGTGVPQGAMQVTVQDMGAQSRAKGGYLASDKGAKFLEMALSSDLYSLAADMKELFAATQILGLDKDFWMSLFPQDGTIMEMYHQNAWKFTKVPPIDRYKATLLRAPFMLAST